MGAGSGIMSYENPCHMEDTLCSIALRYGSREEEIPCRGEGGR